MKKLTFEDLLELNVENWHFEEFMNGLRSKNYEDEAYKNAGKLASMKWKIIAKPLGSLGMFEDDIVRMAELTGNHEPAISTRDLIVFCSDNGIVEEGVTQTDSSVTTAVAGNISLGKSCSHLMAEIAGIKVIPVDIGMKKDALSGTVNPIVSCKIRRGTRNFLKEPAMTREEVMKAIFLGYWFVESLKDEGCQAIALGEMGIGNTTTSAAVTAVLLGVDSDLVTGKGAGLSSKGLERKKAVIKDAIALHKPDREDPIDILAKLGGYDLAAMVGVYLGGAYYDMPVVIDGVITQAAAALAYKLLPESRRCMFASHATTEPACRLLLDYIGLRAPLDAGMRLGEGTGAVTLFPMWDMAFNVYNKMITFQQMEIEAYKPL